MAYLAEGEVGLIDSIKADYARFIDFNAQPGKSRLRSALNVLTLPMFHSVLLVRLARAAQRTGLVPLARIFMYLNEVIYFVELSPKAVIGPGLVMAHAGSGCAAGTRIGKNATLLMFVHLGVAGYPDPSRDGPPTIGDDVILSANCSVFGPVTIGSRCVVGTGVRLFKSLPDDSIVVAPQRHKITGNMRGQSVVGSPEDGASGSDADTDDDNG